MPRDGLKSCFVEITNEETNITKVGNLIAEKKKNGLTPEDAMEILGMTNHYIHIKSIIAEINKLPKDERRAYKAFVLGCVAGRMCSEENYKELLYLSDRLGWYDEFKRAGCSLDTEKIYDNTLVGSLCNRELRLSSARDLRKYKGKNLTAFIDADEGDIFMGFHRYPNSFRAGCFKKIRFKEDATIGLRGKNLPNIFDVSMCSGVVLEECKASTIKALKLKEGVKVCLFGIHDFPENLDLSMCSEVHAESCDLSGVKALKFKEGVKVMLFEIHDFPKNLDLSMCSEVLVRYCDLSGISELKLKSRKQEKEFFIDGVQNFKGKIIYTDEPQNPTSQISRDDDFDR